MPEIKVRKADGRLSTMIVDEEFVEKMHNNWKSQQDNSGDNHKLSELHSMEIEEERKRILKIIRDTLHEGYSIDTRIDQDYVYEVLKHRIEGIFFDN